MGGAGDTLVSFEHFVENHNTHILLIFVTIQFDLLVNMHGGSKIIIIINII